MPMKTLDTNYLKQVDFSLTLLLDRMQKIETFVGSGPTGVVSTVS